MFGLRYQFPIHIVEFLTTSELMELSCTCLALRNELQWLRVKRKTNAVTEVMRYFHTGDSLIFSTHRFYQENFEQHIRRLFHFIPELFIYLYTHSITYMDLSDPYRYGSTLLDLHTMQENLVHELLYEFLEHLSNNKTLVYCNLSIFSRWINRDDIILAVKEHPLLYHVEIGRHPSYSLPLSEPTSLFRIRRSEFEWRHYPPPL